jgi:hypothetical protein
MVQLAIRQMKKVFQARIWIILLALVALIVLVILSSGLNRMTFDSPRLVGFEDIFNFSKIVNEKDVPASSWLRNLIMGMLLVLFLLFLGPIRPQTSKDLIKTLLRFTFFAFVTMLVLARFAQTSPLLNGEILPVTAVPGSNAEPQPFSPPDVGAQSEFWITSLLVIVMGGIAIVVFNRLIDRWLGPKKGLDEIAAIAHSTLNDLSGTTVSKNTIIRCYIRMNSAVNKYRGITRGAAMTPAEFALYLENAGLPRSDIQGLTRVFERVRYGKQNISPDDIKEAKQCLTSILMACKAQP